MVKRILFSFILALVVAAGKSQTPDFNYKEIAPDANCKPVLEFSVIAPAATSTYAWDFGDGNTGTDATVTHTFDAAGTFNVTLTENGDAAKVKTIAVEVKPFDFFRAVRDNSTPGVSFLTYKIGSPFFAAANGYTFSWAISNAEGYSVDPASTSWEFLHTFPTAGNYNITCTITATSGCTSTKSRVLAVVDTLSVPNVFSPDGDGVNDVWKITSNGKDKLSVKIYSRAGALVYEEHAAVVLWDGKTIYGKDLVSGVYYYVVERDDNAFPPQKGFFYLLRGKS